MILHDPFIIGSRLFPAIKIGDATLSLASAAWTDKGASVLGKRMKFGFYLDTPEFEYFDDRMRSGCGGYDSLVEAFEAFLAFMEASVESYDYELRYPGREGENTTLFPRHVVEWAHNNRYAVEEVRSLLQDENGDVLTDLIED